MKFSRSFLASGSRHKLRFLCKLLCSLTNTLHLCPSLWSCLQLQSSSLPWEKGGRVPRPYRAGKDVPTPHSFNSALSFSAEETLLAQAKQKWDTKVCGRMGEKDGKSKSSIAKTVVTLARGIFYLTLMAPFLWIRHFVKDGITA